MWNKYSDAIIFAIATGIPWLTWQWITSIKAKAFNEGYKRGRSSINVREIVK